MKTKCEYSGTLFIISRKYFSVFRGPHLPLDAPFWTRCFPLVMQSRKAGFPFAARARKREPCLQRYVSRMTRTENFLSQFFSKIFWKPLLSTFYGTLFIISRKYFSVLIRSPHSAPTHRYTILDSRLLPWNAISEGRMMINHSTLEYHVTNFNTFFRWLWRKNQNPNTLL